MGKNNRRIKKEKHLKARIEAYERALNTATKPRHFNKPGSLKK